MSQLTRLKRPDNTFRSEVTDVLLRLIEAESPSGGEHEAVETMLEIMKEMGLPGIEQRVGSRSNVVVLGASANPLLLFCSHIDTVPRVKSRAGEPRVEDDIVCGLGACDAKGSVAAMLFAMRNLVASPQFADKVGLAILVGEETSGDGGLRLVRDAFRARYAIVGEPTGLEIPWAQAGYLQLRVVAEGEPRHAFARHGRSAMDLALDSIQKIRGFVENRGSRLPAAERPYVFLQCIKGGSNDKFWYLRHRCEATLNINVHPTWNPEELAKEIETLVAACLDPDDASLELRVLDWDSAVEFSSPELGSAVLAAFSQRGMKSVRTYMRSWTDAATLEWKGTRSVVLGPGTLDVAHSPAEAVKISDVELAAKIYCDIAERLISQVEAL